MFGASASHVSSCPRLLTACATSTRAAPQAGKAPRACSSGGHVTCRLGGAGRAATAPASSSTPFPARRRTCRSARCCRKRGSLHSQRGRFISISGGQVSGSIQQHADQQMCSALQPPEVLAATQLHKVIWRHLPVSTPRSGFSVCCQPKPYEAPEEQIDSVPGENLDPALLTLIAIHTLCSLLSANSLCRPVLTCCAPACCRTPSHGGTGARTCAVPARLSCLAAQSCSVSYARGGTTPSRRPCMHLTDPSRIRPASHL